jgi:hypothetical protein
MGGEICPDSREEEEQSEGDNTPCDLKQKFRQHVQIAKRKERYIPANAERKGQPSGPVSRGRLNIYLQIDRAAACFIQEYPYGRCCVARVTGFHPFCQTGLDEKVNRPKGCVANVCDLDAVQDEEVPQRAT